MSNIVIEGPLSYTCIESFELNNIWPVYKGNLILQEIVYH